MDYEEKMKEQMENLRSKLLEYGVVSEDALELVASVSGHTLSTYEKVLFLKTGCTSYDEWYETTLRKWEEEDTINPEY